MVCATGQHRETFAQALEACEIEPNYGQATVRGHQTPSDAAGAAPKEPHPIGAKNPDWVVIHGDTTRAFVAYPPASRRQVPVGHVEVGLRAEDTPSPFPEALIRPAVSVLAENDIH